VVAFGLWPLVLGLGSLVFVFGTGEAENLASEAY